MHDAYPVCAFSGSRARSSVLGVGPVSVSGPRPWKDEGQGRYDFPPILRPGRGPRTQGRTPNLVPGTWDPGPSTGFAPRAGYRTPSRGTGKRAHRVCILGFEGGAWNG